MSGMGQDMARQSLAQEMIERDGPRREPVTDIDRKAEPDERPDPRAQWDEVRGVWVIWDEEQQRWQVLEDDGADAGSE